MGRGQLQVQNIANTAWTFGTVDLSDAPLVGEVCKWCMGNFNSQNVGNMAWAFATVGHLGALLLSTLARAAERCVCNFKVPGILNTAWAFARVGSLDAYHDIGQGC